MSDDLRIGWPDGRPTVGIVGAGQLGRMLYQAAIDLDLPVRVLAAEPGSAAAEVARSVTVGDPGDATVLADFAAGCDVVTFEHELVEPDAVAAVEALGHLARPGAASWRRLVDKAEQRRALRELGIPTPPALLAQGPERLRRAVERIGCPAVLKATRGGYDGRGILRLLRIDDLDAVGASASRPWLVEPVLAIERELAVQVVRAADGSMVIYPVVESFQEAGICRSVVAPAPVPAPMAAHASHLARQIAEHLDVVGVLAVELFVVDGELLVNELAPRVHNTGHYTIEACATSQFENHLRAVAGLPLGDPSLIVPAAAMANLLGPGGGVGSLRDLADVPGVRVHLYGKHARRGRKVGHVTACGPDPDQARRRAERAAALLTARRDPSPSSSPGPLAGVGAP